MGCSCRNACEQIARSGVFNLGTYVYLYVRSYSHVCISEETNKELSAHFVSVGQKIFGSPSSGLIRHVPCLADFLPTGNPTTRGINS